MVSDSQLRLRESVSWRIVTELWGWFPDQFWLLETHPGGGMYDCLSLCQRELSLKEVVEINRNGSLHCTASRKMEYDSGLNYDTDPDTADSDPESIANGCRDWCERMLDNPKQYLDEITRRIGYRVPDSLPFPTPATLAFRYIAEFLTDVVGRQEHWECRNGVFDTSGWGGGKNEGWFELFPTTGTEPVVQLPEGIAKRLDPSCCYWFLLKDGQPVLCLDTDGRLHKQDRSMFDLPTLYLKSNQAGASIAETGWKCCPECDWS